MVSVQFYQTKDSKFNTIKWLKTASVFHPPKFNLVKITDSWGLENCPLRQMNPKKGTWFFRKVYLKYTYFWCTVEVCFKLVSAISYHFFNFSTNDSPLKTMKNIFYSSKKLFSFTKYSIFCIFSFLSTLHRFKRTNGSGIIYDAMNWLA